MVLASPISAGRYNGKCSMAVNFSRDATTIDISNQYYNGDISTLFQHHHQMSIFVQKEKNATENYCTLTSNLPTSLSYNLTSTWIKPLPSLSGLINLVTQAAGGAVEDLLGVPEKTFASGVNRLTQVSVWNGTEPLEMTLKLQVLDDNYHSSDTSFPGINPSLMHALGFLGDLVLPQAPATDVSFYTPPPSPVSGKISATGKLITTASYARIGIQLGGILFLDNCVIKKVGVSYPNTEQLILKKVDGVKRLLPLRAEITLEVSTLEALTTEAYGNMLALNNQETNMFGVTADETATK